MPNELELKLITTAAGFLKVDPSALNLDSGPGDLPRWDSFAQVGLIAEIEARFDLAFDVDEITTFETLRDMLEAIRSRLPA